MKALFGIRRAGTVLFVAGAILGSAVTAIAQQQIHMENALHALGTARYELSVANNDKGGHRVKAMNLVNSAISEVHLGMRYSNNNR